MQGTFGWFSVGLMNLALASPILVEAFSEAHKSWLLFLGGFHSSIVHFPIALVCLVLVLEWYGWRRRDIDLREPIRIVLTLALLASLVAPLFGWMLAFADGYSGDLVESHMLAGTLVPVTCALALVFNRYRLTSIYRLSLLAAVLIVCLAGFLGGQIAHGRDHLTRSMPDSLRALTGIEQTKAMSVDTNTYFGARVAPIISARCISCHGAEKSKGQLRLDSYEAIMTGGSNGVIVVPGDVAASELYRRITLPAEHKNVMPRDGDVHLTEVETANIGRWIERGATSSALLTEVEDGSIFVVPVSPVEVAMPTFDPQKVIADRSELAAIVSSLQHEYPNMLVYESRSSAYLELNATMMGDSFGDAELKAFAPVADHIVRAELSGTSVTDASSAVLEAMIQLKKLRIGHTGVSDETLVKLAALPEIVSLNLSGIKISDQTRAILSQRPRLLITGKSVKN